MQKLLWCLNLSSADGARAAKHRADLELAPSRERAWAWEGLEDDQRKTLGIQAKEALLHDGTCYIEVCDSLGREYGVSGAEQAPFFERYMRIV